MITVKCFALVRELSQCASLTVPFEPGMTIASLQHQLAHRDANWQLALEGKVLSACNQTLVDSDCALCDGDEVAFFPPVTGG
ncbi:molybdopterin synthase sulfur carrier subunit [Alteromonas aestuariivivens]|uniref:Molybdopterin synthase sulfur carrier subunit n=1 Tax=Alteromonas aestuariivivens TaxID=1938339 RepID=A0A3D8M4K0_9ALTE|nr:MoaD/ThiS family protein [Alteromonas aestuariivivens]RDV24475.1 molybdopterin synthase sulfur carrier subunit [Alteromonas aestuariivivens]